MTQMDHVEIIDPGPQDNFRPPTPRLQERYPRRPNQRFDDNLSRDFQRLELGSRKDKAKDKRRSIGAGRIVRTRPSGGGKAPHRYYEFYRFERRGDDWTLADKIPMKVPQDDLKKKVAKDRGKTNVLDAMRKMNSLRCRQINRLLDQKNEAERDRDVEWIPVLVETSKQRGNNVFAFDIIIAQSFRPGGPTLRDKRNSFAGEKSDLRDPIKFKGRDRDTDRERSRGRDRDRDRERSRDGDNYGGRKRNSRDHDPFDNEQLFTPDGKPIDNNGGSFINRQPLPPAHPIAGPIPGFQPQPLLPPPPPAWSDPMGPGDFPMEMHHDQPPIEVFNDHQNPHGGHAGNGILHLDQLLDKNPVNSGANPGSKKAHPNGFPKAGSVDLGPHEPERPRSGGRRKSGSRPRPIYTGQGPRRRSRGPPYSDSSVDDDDEVHSVYFNGDEKSSMSSYGEEPERFIQRRGSLNRKSSTPRGESKYREHRRRGSSYTPRRREVVIEPGRTPKRPEGERRQIISYPEPRQITYPHRNGRDWDVIDEPLSPVTQRGYSPAPLQRRKNRSPLPVLVYPDELGGKSRWAEDYMNMGELQNKYREEDARRLEAELDRRYREEDARRLEAELDRRYREEDLRRLERDLEARDRRRGGREFHGEYRDQRFD